MTPHLRPLHCGLLAAAVLLFLAADVTVGGALSWEDQRVTAIAGWLKGLCVRGELRR